MAIPTTETVTAGAKRAFAWVVNKPVETIVIVIIVAVIGLIAWSTIATVGEEFDKWRHDKKIEKLDRKVEDSDRKSGESNAKANEINSEGNEKHETVKRSMVETERLQRDVERQRKTIEQLRRAANEAGSVNSNSGPSRPTPDDEKLCARAVNLGVQCNLGGGKSGR